MKTRSHLLTVCALVASLTALTLTSGCLAVAAGAGAAGAVAYVRGDLQTTLTSSLDDAERATNRAIQDLAFAKVSEKKDALLAVFIARNAADKKIEIKLDHVGDKTTEVHIRVGVLGDQALSLAVLDKIKANL